MSRLSKNILYNVFGQGATLILSLIAVKFIFKELGEDALGIIYFTAMVNVVLCATFEMGICATTVREISSYFKSDPNYIKKLIRTFSFFYWSIFLLLGIIIFFLSPLIVKNWIHLKTIDSATAIYIVRILAITSLMALPKSFYTSLFRGLQRMEFNNFIDVITTGLQHLGAIVILVFKGNLFLIVYWFAGCYILRTFIYFIISARFFTLLALIPGYYLSVIKRNFKFASKMMVVTIASTIHMQADKLIISKLLPVGMLGYYSSSYSAVSKPSLITSAVSQAAFPSFSALHKGGDRNNFIKQYKKLHDLVCFGLVPIFAVIPFISIPLFSYIFNKEIAKLLFLPIIFLCIGFYMNATLNMPYIFSLAVGKPDIAAKINFYALFVVLPVTVVLIYFFGLIGAGLSWIFYHIFSYFYGMPKICKECLNMSVKNWYLHILKISSLVSLTYGVALITLKMIDKYSSIPLLITFYVGASVIFLTISYFMIDKGLQKTALRFLKTIKLKLSII